MEAVGEAGNDEQGNMGCETTGSVVHVPPADSSVASARYKSQKKHIYQIMLIAIRTSFAVHILLP